MDMLTQATTEIPRVLDRAELMALRRSLIMALCAIEDTLGLERSVTTKREKNCNEHETARTA